MPGRLIFFTVSSSSISSLLPVIKLVTNNSPVTLHFHSDLYPFFGHNRLLLPLTLYSENAIPQYLFYVTFCLSL